MHRKPGILIVSLLLLLLPTGSSARSVELQYHEVKQIYSPDFTEVSNAGFQKIIVRSFLNNGTEGGLLFRSGGFRMAYPGFETIIRSYTGRKFELWGWLITRKYDWIRDHDMLDTAFRKGKREEIFRLDLFNPVVRREIISAFRSLAETGVDGILIQDDLAFRNDEGFSAWGLKTFEKKAGVPAREKLMMEAGSPYNRKWIAIKKEILSELLNGIIEACREVNNRIKIGVNVYYETAVLGERGTEWLSQDLDTLLKTNVDHIYLMMYHRQMKRELKLSWEKIKQLFHDGIRTVYRKAGNRLVVKLETRDWDTGLLIPFEEMKTFIDLIPDEIQRVCLTPVKDTGMVYLKRLLKALQN